MKSRFAVVIQILKRRKILTSGFVLVAGLALGAADAMANPFVLDWRVIGVGADAGTCETGSLMSGCTSLPTGSVQGTHIGAGTYTVSVTAGSDNGGLTDPSNHAKNSNSGLCLPANGSGTVVAADGSTINYNTVGWICEEAGSGSSYHYNGTYRISGGTGRFSTAVGGGSLTYTVEKDPLAAVTTGNGSSYMKIDGTINF
jgi:hypothetical protein